MAVDNFQGGESAVNSPAYRWRVISPSNDADLVEVPKFLYIGTTGGSLTALDKDGNSATFLTVAGQKLDIRPHRIMATGTAATPIIACY